MAYTYICKYICVRVEFHVAHKTQSNGMTLGFCGQTTPTKTNKIYETFKQKASDKCTKGVRKKKFDVAGVVVLVE